MRKLFLISCLLPLLAQTQVCNYSGNLKDAAEICELNKGRRIATNKQADMALYQILAVTGMSKRFVLQECEGIENCIATAYKGIRYILYDNEFMEIIARKTNSWSNLSILAHEIGHHVNGHSLDLIVYAVDAAQLPTLSESRQMELEADEFSGFVMQKLGASLEQAQQAIQLISTNENDTYSTHPSKEKRLKAIEIGFNNARSNDFSSNENYSLNKESFTADEYFYKALEHEDHEENYLAIANYSKAIELGYEDKHAVYMYRGVIYDRVKDYQSALSDLNRAISINPNHPHPMAYFIRAKVNISLKRWGDARADMNMFISKTSFPSSLDYFLRGYANTMLQNDYEALEDLNMSIRKGTELGDAYGLRALLKGKDVEYYGVESICRDYQKACTLGGSLLGEGYYCQTYYQLELCH